MVSSAVKKNAAHKTARLPRNMRNKLLKHTIVWHFAEEYILAESLKPYVFVGTMYEEFLCFPQSDVVMLKTRVISDITCLAPVDRKFN